MRLGQNDTALLIVDVQGRLAGLMHEREALMKALGTLIRGARALELPIVWTEQVPEKLGPTVPELAELMSDTAPIAKNSFSCCGSEQLVARLRDTGRRQVLIAGIEAHVCVYQTVLDLLGRGHEVQVVADAVSSRSELNRTVGMERMRLAGALPTTVEMALFELMRTAEHPAFRGISKLMR